MSEYGLTDGERFMRPMPHDPNRCHSERCRMRRRKPAVHSLSNVELVAIIMLLLLWLVGFMFHVFSPSHANAQVIVGKHVITAEEFCRKHGGRDASADVRSFCAL